MTEETGNTNEDDPERVQECRIGISLPFGIEEHPRDVDIYNVINFNSLLIKNAY